MSWRTLLAICIAAAVVTVAALTLRTTGCGEQLTIEGEGFELRETDEGLYVVATSDEDFYVGALFWILQIGDVAIDRSSYPDLWLKTIEFPVPEGARDLLADGDPVSVRYGNPVGSGALGYALVTADAVGTGQPARLRIIDDC